METEAASAIPVSLQDGDDISTVEVSVMLPSGESVATISVPSSLTIAQVKDRIETASGSPASSQKLVFGDVVLDNTRSVGSYGFHQDQTCLVLIVGVGWEWDLETSSKRVAFSEDGRRATRIEPDDCLISACFGCCGFASGQHKWGIRVDHSRNYPAWGIAVRAKVDPEQHFNAHPNRLWCWMLFSNGSFYHKGSKVMVMEPIREGDLLEFEFDVDAQTLQVQRNGETYSFGIEVEPGTEIHPYVQLSQKDDQCTLEF